MRSAKALVKFSGMCWTNMIGKGKFAGKFFNTSGSATGPPVEAPISKTFKRFFSLPGSETGADREARGALVASAH